MSAVVDSELWECPGCGQRYIGGRAPRCVQCLLRVLRAAAARHDGGELIL
jgi:hypothetical protein